MTFQPLPESLKSSTEKAFIVALDVCACPLRVIAGNAGVTGATPNCSTPSTTWRISSLLESAMSRSSEPSTATPAGLFSCAAVAAPPSPELPSSPLLTWKTPATV